MNRSVVFFLLSILVPVLSDTFKWPSCVKDHMGKEHCYADDYDGPCYYEDPKESLYMWDPVKKGHVRELELEDGVKYKMITRAIRPKVFELPNFLNEEECDHIMALAESTGLFSSKLHIDPETIKTRNFTHGRTKIESASFSRWDENGDGEITPDEVKSFAAKIRLLYLQDPDVDDMFKNLKLKEWDDRKISYEEFQNLNTDGIDQYLKYLKEEHPRFRDRYSEQAWLRQGKLADPIMKRIRERVIRLTKLPRRIASGGEPLQVVKYRQHGHYHAHFDGQARKEFPDFECCHFVADQKPTECRLCRFITILYYLNDVEEGGETAFPVADRENYKHAIFKRREMGDFYNLSEFCHNATLVVPPKKGKAIMWYNHDLDESGWMGAKDDYSLHGGCDIKKGVKWVANNWLTAPEYDSYDQTSLYSLEDDILAEDD